MACLVLKLTELLTVKKTKTTKVIAARKAQLIGGGGGVVEAFCFCKYVLFVKCSVIKRRFPEKNSHHVKKFAAICFSKGPMALLNSLMQRRGIGCNA